MRLAIFSDVHADRLALEDALRAIERLGADRIVCAGDLVDYGYDPDGTVSLIAERSIATITGNHDRWATVTGDSRAAFDPARGTIAFLRSLPPSIDVDDGATRIAIRHGTARSDMRGIWPIRTPSAEVLRELDEAKAKVLVVGHTHIPFCLESEGRLVVNPGALLRQPVGRVAKKPLLFDAERRRFVAGDSGTGGGTFGILEIGATVPFRVYRASDGREIEPIRLPV